MAHREARRPKIHTAPPAALFGGERTSLVQLPVRMIQSEQPVRCLNALI